jgi:XTP/dITP diphosphohydrolase
MKLIFATNNLHKIEEIQPVLPSSIELITLKQAGIEREIPEPHDSLEENAREKAQTIYSLTETSCFSEDTGLEVRALQGAPGVRSARYAEGDPRFASNVEKLLHELREKNDRTAQFRTVICLILQGRTQYFEGLCAGTIIDEPRGTKGFGYDPVFVPDGDTRTFAEMELAQKNLFSHRRKAVDRLVAFLNELNVKEGQY